MWCDEIILVDKCSTDKTVEIALGYGDKVKVCYLENTLAYDSSEWIVALENSSSDWIALFTASDVIHRQLVHEIFKVIENEECTNRQVFI